MDTAVCFRSIAAGGTKQNTFFISVCSKKCLEHARLEMNKKARITKIAHACKCEILANLFSVCLIITPYWLTRFQVYTSIVQLCLHVRVGGEDGGLAREKRNQRNSKGTNSTFELISSFVNNGVIIMRKHRVGHVELINSVQNLQREIDTLMSSLLSSLINI